MYYIATFFSHFGAIRFQRECSKIEVQAQMMPVPRSLSSSCGTCVRFLEKDDLSAGHLPAWMKASEEVEQLVRETEQGYEVIYDGE